MKGGEMGGAADKEGGEKECMHNFGGESWKKLRLRLKNSIKNIVKKYVTMGSTGLFWLGIRKSVSPQR
jgi:hypothetical protein